MITSGVALRIGYENVFPLLQVEKGKLKRDFLQEITLFSYKFITLQPNMLNYGE